MKVTEQIDAMEGSGVDPFRYLVATRVLAVVAALGSPQGESSQENQLTLARAAVVRDYLVNNFRLDDSRI